MLPMLAQVLSLADWQKLVKLVVLPCILFCAYHA